MSEIPNMPEAPAEGATKEQVLSYLRDVDTQLCSYLMALRNTIALLTTPEV